MMEKRTKEEKGRRRRRRRGREIGGEASDEKRMAMFFGYSV